MNELKLYLRYLKIERNLSPATLSAYERDLNNFLHFSFEQLQLLARPEIITEIDKYLVRDYLAFLTRAEYAKASVSRHLAAIKGFSQYLFLEGKVQSDFAAMVRTPKSQNTIPEILTMDEIVKFFGQDVPGKSPALQSRNRAIFELLYATGIRVAELVSLDLADFDQTSQLLHVLGKGNKERIVPLGEHALNSVLTYYHDYRPSLVQDSKEKALFVNARGRRITSRGIQYILEQYAMHLEIHKQVTPHTFRHTFATHLLDHGADLRSIQELLGHSSLSSTQIYTKVSTSHLKSVYNRAHPRA